MKPKLTKILIEDLYGKSCIRLDFDNDRHFSSRLIYGDRDELSAALSELAFHIKHDEHLDEQP